MRTIKPPRLTAGDTVGVCSPSATIAHKQDLFNRAKANFEAKTGLTIQLAPHVFGRHYYSAGTSEERLSDFHQLIQDKSVKALIFSTGGDTAIDLVSQLDYDLIARNPKIMAGISDATTLLSAITAKTGLVTFLGVEFMDFAHHDMAYTFASIKKTWFDGKIGTLAANSKWCDLDNNYNTYCGWQVIQEGAAKGKFVGGNLQSFMQLVGTEYELPFKNNILFLETYRLPKKQIHKALVQLKIRGVLDQINGLVVGYCLECDNPEVIGNDQPILETIREITAEYDFPVMQVGEIGHRVENILQPLGARIKMDTDTLELTVLEDVTN